MRYEIYRDVRKKWRWRLRSANHKIIAVSSESYVNKSDCLHSIDLAKSSSNAPVNEV